MITAESIDQMISQVAGIAARCSCAMERGMAPNRIMAHLDKEGTRKEVATRIMDAVVAARKEFDAVKPITK